MNDETAMEEIVLKDTAGVAAIKAEEFIIIEKRVVCEEVVRIAMKRWRWRWRLKREKNARMR